MKSVVVTGASTGIGWGCVKVLIASGFRVFGSVRREVDADRLSKEFGSNFTPLIFDVTDEAAVAAGANEVEAALGAETFARAGQQRRHRRARARCSTSRSKSSSISLPLISLAR